MERSKSLQLAFLAAVCLAVQLPPAHAAIVISGNVDPADPNNWTSSTNGYVGKSASGELEVNSGSSGRLNITGGATVSNSDGFIGYTSGTTSVVTVDGAGSTWTNSGDLCVGRGSGALNITAGAAVSATSVSISNESLLAIDVGNGSLLEIDGGSGTYQAVGGTRHTGHAADDARCHGPVVAKATAAKSRPNCHSS